MIGSRNNLIGEVTFLTYQSRRYYHKKAAHSNERPALEKAFLTSPAVLPLQHTKADERTPTTSQTQPLSYGE
jgi:hypothetical protein